MIRYKNERGQEVITSNDHAPKADKKRSATITTNDLGPDRKPRPAAGKEKPDAKK